MPFQSTDALLTLICDYPALPTARYRWGHSIGNRSEFSGFCPNYLLKTSAIGENLTYLPGGVSHIFTKKSQVAGHPPWNSVYQVSLISCLAARTLLGFWGTLTWVHCVLRVLRVALLSVEELWRLPALLVLQYQTIHQQWAGSKSSRIQDTGLGRDH